MKETKYPVDSANFRKIREGKYVYVDKTIYIHKLIEKGSYYFLARPRRFGKSLFLDTLAEYFKGNRELFKGLEIDRLQPREWETYPVLRFNLSSQDYLQKETLYAHLAEKIRNCEIEFNLPSSPNDTTISDRFYNLLRSLAKVADKRVVILIDEYDAPLSATIGKPELQEIYREQLQGFYSVLKAAEEFIQFCFLTGVTRYGKVSVFSGLNNLNDITFSDEYAAICGITNDELHHYYQQGVLKLSQKLQITTRKTFDILKFHYDGYHFSESMVDIYNPFSINYAMFNSKIEDYWCQSGVPTILSKSILKNDFDISRLKGMKVDKAALSDLSIHAVNPVPLFYQTGYVTLKDYEARRQRFTIGYPNREVESSILNNILNVYIPTTSDKRNLIYDMEDVLEEGNTKEFIKILSSFLSSVPNQLHKYVDKYENYYHTIFYCLTTLIGLDVEAEYSTSEGFIDLLIKTKHYIYIIELKVNGTAEDAIRQIEEKHYAAPFASDSRQLIKIGIGFSTETHSILSYLVC